MMTSRSSPCGVRGLEAPLSPCWSLASNCSTRDSSLLTMSLSASTVSSLMGAIVEGERLPGGIGGESMAIAGRGMEAGSRKPGEGGAHGGEVEMGVEVGVKVGRVRNRQVLA